MKVVISVNNRYGLKGIFRHPSIRRQECIVRTYANHITTTDCPGGGRHVMNQYRLRHSCLFQYPGCSQRHFPTSGGNRTRFAMSS